MKHAKAIFSILAIVSALIFSSCNKSNTEISTPPASTADGFTWTENGGTTVKVGFTPFFLAQSHSLFVQDAAGASAGVLFEFSLTTLAVGTYNLGPNYYVDFLFPGHTTSNKFDPKAGSIIISSNANGKISGMFTATGSAGTISSVKGNFNNITIQ